jgi:type I restriction enzyme S subunit
MASITQTKLSETILENRWAAEYFNPKYSFIPNTKYEWVRIGKILTNCQYGISISMNEQKKGFPIFRMNEIENCVLGKAAKYADISNALFNQFKLKPNDVLFNRTNSIDFVGRTGIFKEGDESTFASYLVKVNTNEQKILPEFLTVYLNTNFGKGQIRRRAMPSINQANVSAAELKRIFIPLIEIEVQIQISELFNKSYELKKISQTLYLQASDLLKQELGLDRITFEKNKSYVATFSEVANNNRSDADYYQIKYRKLEEHINSIETVSLSSICTLLKGFEVGTPAYTENGPTFLRVSNLTKEGFAFGNSDKYISEETYKSLKSYQPKIGDILLTKDGTIGTCYAVDEYVEGIISSGIMNLNLYDQKITSEYLALVINSKICQMQAERECSGALIMHWKPEQIRNLRIPVLKKETMDYLSELCSKSKIAMKESKRLLEEAKSRVEQLIEEAANK